MAVVKIPFVIILQCILEELGLPHATFEEQNADGPIYTCNVYYLYENGEGTKFVNGLSAQSMEDAKNLLCFAAIEHLKSIYDLDIVDFNHK